MSDQDLKCCDRCGKPFPESPEPLPWWLTAIMDAIKMCSDCCIKQLRKDLKIEC